MTAFLVQKRMCASCIYHPNSSLDIKKLEADVADPKMKGFFRGYRICHHSKALCCRGFWDKHRNDFSLGQIAQRLNLVAFVHEDRFSVSNQKGK